MRGWQALGPDPGAGGAGCLNPAGSKGDIRYNADYHALQYCDGTTWQQMPTYAKAQPNNGLVGWWTLDDGTSGTTPATAADSSGNVGTGTLTSSPTWTTSGKINNALTFHGNAQGDYVAVADAAPAPLRFMDAGDVGQAQRAAGLRPVCRAAGQGQQHSHQRGPAD